MRTEEQLKSQGFERHISNQSFQKKLGRTLKKNITNICIKYADEKRNLFTSLSGENLLINQEKWQDIPNMNICLTNQNIMMQYLSNQDIY